MLRIICEANKFLVFVIVSLHLLYSLLIVMNHYVYLKFFGNDLHEFLFKRNVIQDIVVKSLRIYSIITRNKIEIGYEM